MTTEIDSESAARAVRSGTRIVGVGASAGGLSALAALIRNLPADSGLALVVVSHTTSTARDGIVGFLQSHSPVPVVQVEDGMAIEPDRVHVGPAGADVIVVDGTLQVVSPDDNGGVRAQIDRLFRSLAHSAGKDACAVVLSGTGNDGTLGLKRVKEHGGLTVAQQPDDAEYDGMPRSAIATGLVDLVLPAAAIPERLVGIVRDPQAHALTAGDPRRPSESVADALRDILTLIRIRSGHDFSNYKRATLLRRVSRRMQVCDCESIGDYLVHLRERPTELAALLRDFLISVTSFFRDPDAWQVVDRQVLPRIFAGRGPASQVRVWVAACATGEEAYTMAILCAEHLARLPEPVSVQVFATDIDEEALGEARAGRYPDTIAADVSPERLARYFVREGEHYRVKKELREMVMFSSHNLLRDPPFSKLDAATCRNLLIYLDREAQDRVLGVIHFGLRPEGFLVLGSSESAESTSMLFGPVDAKQRIYVRRHATGSIAPHASFPTPKWQAVAAPPSIPPGERVPSFGEVHHKLVEEYAAPSVLVNDEVDILHLSARAGRYLSMAGGEPTRNLLRLVHEDLRLDLRALVYAARQPGGDTAPRTVRTTIGGEPRLVELGVRAFDYPEVGRGLLLVTFDERAPDAGEPARPADRGAPPMEPVVQQLEDELHRTRDQLRSTVEQYETSLEELTASNEELHAMNEELRSATEELETSKEELQSVNEELTTLNHELKDKIDEVSRANSDLHNLMMSTDIGVLFLDRKMNVKRFTPRVQDLFNLIPSDLGRPLDHLTHRLEIDDLADTAAEVLQSLRPVERAVRSRDGRHYLIRLHAYRSDEDRIDGVVLSFFDVTEIERAEHTLRSRETMLQLAERAADAGLWELDVPTGRIRMSADALRIHGIDPSAELTLDTWLERLHPDDRPAAARAVQRAIGAREDLTIEFRILHPGRGPRWLWVNGRAEPGVGGARSLSGITIDVTDRRRTEAALRASEERFRLALRTAPVVMLSQDADLRYTWGHMLGGPVEFIGKTDHDLFTAEEAARLTEVKRAVIDTGVGRREEIGLTVAGNTRYYDFNIEPIVRDDGTIAGVSSAAVDVTSSKLAELSLRDGDRKKDEFLATLAHELRNPLAPLQAALDIQHLAGGDLDRIERARGIMERQVAQIVRLVDDLLDVSRITQGKINLRITRFPLGAAIDAALEATRGLFEPGGQRLVLELPEAPLELEGDYTRLAQVLTNLLSNAAKYTPRGGTITLSAGLDLARTHLVLRLRDDGVGISQEMLPHVFDMFAQADVALERAQGGLGIGLNLVRRLVELHGGTIEAHSAGAGEGSEFVMRLPVTRDKEQATLEAAESRPPVRPGTPRRVLVVDDNRDVTDSICELLRMIGHEAHQAHDGPAALRAFADVHPDVVLLDLGLPGMSGLDVARRIRAEARGHEVTLVAVTGWGQPDDLARTHDAGFDHHLVKPAGLVALREVVGDATPG